MAYVMGQATVPSGGTAGTALFPIPAGLCNVTFYNLGSTAYIGTSQNVNSSNGLQCHSIPTNFFTYVGSRGATLFGSAATATVINYFISTDF